jgi:hypothetical protein
MLVEPQDSIGSYVGEMKYIIRVIEEKIRDNALDAKTLVERCPKNLRSRIENLAYRNAELSFEPQFAWAREMAERDNRRRSQHFARITAFRIIATFTPGGVDLGRAAV